MNLPQDKIGPTVHLPRSILVCGMCRYHKCVSIAVGGRNPEFTHECEHPDIDHPWIGDTHDAVKETPAACPVLREKLHPSTPPTIH